MIYLASPYCHSDPEIREQRFQAACTATARFIAEGHVVFSPIVHGHPLSHLGLPDDWSFWRRYDLQILERCDALVVIMLDGWQQSKGVEAEIAYATRLNKPVWYRAEIPTSLLTLATAGHEEAA